MRPEEAVYGPSSASESTCRALRTLGSLAQVTSALSCPHWPPRSFCGRIDDPKPAPRPRLSSVASAGEGSVLRSMSSPASLHWSSVQPLP